MKVHTTIIVRVEREGDRGEATLSRTIVSVHGDNPSFERGEAAGALRVATQEFIEANALGGTRPL